MNAQLEVLDATPALETSTITTSITKVQGEIAAFDKIAAGIAAIAQQHPKDLAVDVTTSAGMKAALAGRAAWRDPRIAVEKARKAAKAPVLELGKQIDTFAAGLESTLREGEDNYDKQIKAEEARKEAEKAAKVAAEAARVAKHQAVIQYLRGIPADVASAPSDKVLKALNELDALDITSSLEEFQGQAQLAKDETLDKLREMHAAALAHEAEQARIKAEQEAEAARIAAERAELDKLRAEAAERERLAAAERAAAEKAQAEELARQREAQEAELRAAREAQERELAAQREAQIKAEAEARAIREAEERRLAEERAELERQRAEAEAARLAEFDRQQRALKQIQQAAPAMADALRQWRNAEQTNDADELANARIARDEALTAAGF